MSGGHADEGHGGGHGKEEKHPKAHKPKEGRTWVTSAIEAPFRLTWGIAKRVYGVLGSAWDATAGQIGGEFSKAGERLGFNTSQETGALNSVAGVCEGVSDRVYKALSWIGGKPIGGTVGHVLGAPLRIGARVLRSTSNAGSSIISGHRVKLQEGGGGHAASGDHGEPAHAH